jgi:hypothetical protein
MARVVAEVVAEIVVAEIAAVLAEKDSDGAESTIVVVAFPAYPAS